MWQRSAPHRSADDLAQAPGNRVAASRCDYTFVIDHEAVNRDPFESWDLVRTSETSSR